ncbi:MAG: phytoene desaturase family protein [Pyrinomonadaceae bacterium]
MKKKKALIIGGGLGGLATALRLAAKEWDVTVCEQGPTLGGKMNRWEESGFRFDTGPSLITMKWVFEDLFRAVGACIEDHLGLIQMHSLAEYVYDDGTRFNYSSSLPEWLQTIAQLEPRDVDGFLGFMQLGARLFELSQETFLRRPPQAPPDMRSLKALRHLPLRHAWGKYHKTVANYFRSPYLRQLFDRYPTYVGSSPYLSPATLAVVPYIEYAFGGWYIKGGLYQLIEALSSLARQMNITLLTGARVDRVGHESKKVKCVTLADGQRLETDVVVMNGDASMTKALLGGEANPTAVADRSLSGLVFLVGVKHDLPRVAHHSILFSSNYKREFDQLFDERRFPDDPTVYVSVPSRSDRSLVPDAGETLFIMANAPANDDAWSEAEIDRARARVFARLSKAGFPLLDSDVVVSDIWTPRRMGQRYLMPGGSIYGLNSHGWRHAFLRPPNKDRAIGGLYYVGGSSHPGGGSPTVLLSAEITSELIQQHEL